jgi:hypothetical protein
VSSGATNRSPWEGLRDTLVGANWILGNRRGRSEMRATAPEASPVGYASQPHRAT